MRLKAKTKMNSRTKMNIASGVHVELLRVPFINRGSSVECLPSPENLVQESVRTTTCTWFNEATKEFIKATISNFKCEWIYSQVKSVLAWIGGVVDKVCDYERCAVWLNGFENQGCNMSWKFNSPRPTQKGTRLWLAKIHSRVSSNFTLLNILHFP